VTGPAWHADPYALAPGPKSLFTVFGGEHCLGGITGYDVAETTDEDSDRVEAIQCSPGRTFAPASVSMMRRGRSRRTR
jgi:hypothetical protein